MTVKESVPEIFNFVSLAYSQPSLLFCGECTIQSAEGIQQEDSLGPLLFCLTIQPLIHKLKTPYKVFYLDDGTIGGSVEEVQHDLALIEQEGSHLGLKLNHSKSELVWKDATTCDAMLSAVSDLHAVVVGSLF